MRAFKTAGNPAQKVLKRGFWGEVKARVSAEGKGVPSPSFLIKPKTCCVIGAPTTHGQPLAGTDQGPQMIRDAGLRKFLTKLKWRVEEKGDLKFPEPSDRDPVADSEALGGDAHNCYAVGQANKMIADATYAAAKAGKFPLVLGGDHSLAAGSIAGVLRARPNTGIVWVDAHADLNAPHTSPSGNMHGMPLGLLIDGIVNLSLLPGWEWLKDCPRLQPKDLVYVGLRDVDDQERKLVSKLDIRAFTMQHVDRYGIGPVMEMALEHLHASGGDRPLHLSYDIDAVDPGIAPSTGTIVRGGLTYREAHYVAESVAETGQLGSMDMVEVNPSLVPGSGASETADAAVGMINSAMGSRIL